jgi:osmoprotectant transport system ATP-binding protein
VNEVSLEVEPGSFVVLLGPSGCGKTTLLKMVNRLIEPTSGLITIDGVDIRSVNAPVLRRQIGYVIQQTGLFPHMRVEENIAVVPKLLGWKKQIIDDRVDELLDLIGLPHQDYRRRYPAQLSGGEQQRVGLARALAVNPTMMLMDEPFGALDAITRSRLQGELLRLHQALGQTILFVTHDIDEAVRLADIVVVMRTGEIVQFGPPLDIVTHPADDFVSELVGGGDALRRLSLIEVESVMRQPLPNVVRNGESVQPESNLRQVLDHFLRTGESSIQVTSDEGDLLGTVDVDTLWNVASEQPSQAEKR